MGDDLKLGRRDVLGGLTAVGIASAAGGAGSMALFSDSEELENNFLQAGRLDLVVDIELLDVSGRFELAVDGSTTLTNPGDRLTINGSDTTRNGVPVASSEVRFELSDVKPGDWWVWKRCIRVAGNPAYINQTADPDAPDPTDTDGDGEAELQSNENTNDEHGLTEPERAVDETTGAGRGELGRALRVRTGDGYGGGEGVGGEGARGETTTGTPISLHGDQDITFSGETSLNPLDLFFQGTLNHALWALGADLVATDDSGAPRTDADGHYVGVDDPDVGTLGAAGWNGLPLTNPIDRGATGSEARAFETADRYDRDDVDHRQAGPGFGLAQDNRAFTSVGPEGDTSEVCIYEKYFVPLEADNAIQGDSISWQLSVRAVQTRNNTAPFGNRAEEGPAEPQSGSITFQDQSPEAPA